MPDNPTLEHLCRVAFQKDRYCSDVDAPSGMLGTGLFRIGQGEINQWKGISSPITNIVLRTDHYQPFLDEVSYHTMTDHQHQFVLETLTGINKDFRKLFSPRYRFILFMVCLTGEETLGDITDHDRVLIGIY